MRIGTLNVHSGRSALDGRVDDDRLADAVRRLGCDVLAVQEVDRSQERSNGTDQAALVAEAVGAVDHRFAATVSGVPGFAWVPATGDEPDGSPAYGIALVSRFPVSAWRVVQLPPPPRYLPVRLPVPIPGRVLPLLVKEEPRVALVARVESPTGPLTVVTTHLSFIPGWGTRQLRHLVGDLRADAGRAQDQTPLVLAGDLNIGPRAAASASGLRALVRGATWPADRPARQLDHVLADGVPRSAVTQTQVVRTGVSDHRALVLDLDLRE